MKGILLTLCTMTMLLAGKAQAQSKRAWDYQSQFINGEIPESDFISEPYHWKCFYEGAHRSEKVNFEFSMIFEVDGNSASLELSFPNGRSIHRAAYTSLGLLAQFNAENKSYLAIRFANSSKGLDLYLALEFLTSRASVPNGAIANYPPSVVAPAQALATGYAFCKIKGPEFK